MSLHCHFFLKKPNKQTHPQTKTTPDQNTPSPRNRCKQTQMPARAARWQSRRTTVTSILVVLGLRLSRSWHLCRAGPCGAADLGGCPQEDLACWV